MKDTARALRWRRVVFWAYVLILFLVVALKFNGSVQGLIRRIQMYQTIRAQEGNWNLNLVPFDSIRLQLRFFRESWAKMNLVGNVAAFVPFGFLLPLAYPKMRRLAAVLAAGLFATCFIEAFQYVTMLGSCDIDDVMLNEFGCLLGALAFFLYRRSRGGK